jgi:TfoX/Sxy family transcriptional regulator of competence genes
VSNKFQYQAVSNSGDKRWEVMSRQYFEKLTELIAALGLGDALDEELSVKHFFNGAAVYANGKIFASWSPVGLAFKLAAEEVAELIARGQARPLKYFAKSPIKKGYAVTRCSTSRI